MGVNTLHEGEPSVVSDTVAVDWSGSHTQILDYIHLLRLKTQ